MRVNEIPVARAVGPVDSQRRKESESCDCNWDENWFCIFYK